MAEERKYIVRLYDRFDGWIDISCPISKEEAEALWSKETGGGRYHTQFEDGHYYKVFQADTVMLYTPDFLGR